MSTTDPNPRTEPTKVDPSLPFEPLLEVILSRRSRSGESDEPTLREIAACVGFDPRAVARWREENRIPWISADEASVALGLVPILVWPNEWLNVKGDLGEIRAGHFDGKIASSLRKVGEKMAADQAAREATIISDVVELAKVGVGAIAVSEAERVHLEKVAAADLYDATRAVEEHVLALAREPEAVLTA